MSKHVPGNQKHLDLEKRITIEKGLDAGLTLKAIAIQIGKDPTTIAKEIKKHRTEQARNIFNDSKNKCTHVATCKKQNICGLCSSKYIKACRKCQLCNSHCPDFSAKDYHCHKLDKAPYVCNGCNKKTGCRLNKAYYKAATAHRQYRTILTESRVGINISEHELILLDELVTPLVKKGHSPYAILKNHPEIALSEKTIYNYIDAGYLSVKNLDLPKKVKYKIRSTSQNEINDTAVFEGRTYKDFQEYILEYPDTRIVEMDTVVGCEGSRKVLLTLHFNTCELMVAYLLDSKEAICVEQVFDTLEKNMGTHLFCKTFPIILTDRGGEFRHADKLECGISNIIRTSIYYCDPMCSWQKPHCEKNHEFIRKILPKGTSFDGLTQNDVNLMMSHINSYPREILGGHTPLKLAGLLFQEEVLSVLGIKEISADEVNLTKTLLRNKI